MALEIGDKAPDFTAEADNGETVSLSDFLGSKVILYFYPKDSTPGCTTEACDFRDRHNAFEGAGAVVLGVSMDSLKSHVRFKEKQALPFLLLSDPDHAICDLYGTYVLKKNYGREYMGIERSTFIIDREGAIAHVERKVKVKGHAASVLDIVSKLA